MYIILASNLNGKDGTARLAKDIFDHITDNQIKNYVLFSYDASKFNFTNHSLKYDPYSKLNTIYFFNDIFIIIKYFLKRNTYKNIKGIICLSENFSLVGYFLSKLFFVNNYICCYGTYAQRLSVKNKIYKKIFKKSILLVSSNYTKLNLRKVCKKSKIILLKLFVSNSLLHWSNKLKKNFEKKNEFIFVGGGTFFKRRKGFQYLQNLLQRLNKLEDPPLLKIVGNREKYFNYTYIDDKNIENIFNFEEFKKKLKTLYSNHIFLGQLSNEQLYLEYNKSLFNILLADHTDDEYDGFGLVHLEANTAMTYSIGSSLSGSEDAIVYGEAFNPNDIDTIFNYITEIIKHPFIPNYNVDKIRKIENYFVELNQILINESL